MRFWFLKKNKIYTYRFTNIKEITIDEEIPAPVFFYYYLTNFYQNNRRYLKSRSEK